jgi:hypothetical protein
MWCLERSATSLVGILLPSVDAVTWDVHVSVATTWYTLGPYDHLESRRIVVVKYTRRVLEACTKIQALPDGAAAAWQ